MVTFRRTRRYNVIAEPDYRRIGAPELVHTFADGWPDGDGKHPRRLLGGARPPVTASMSSMWGRSVAEIGLPPGSLPTNAAFGGKPVRRTVGHRGAQREPARRAVFEGEVPPLWRTLITPK